MRKTIPWEIEYLDDFSWRFAVIGGWIVYCGNDTSITSTFVKDSDHEWKIKKPEDQIPPAVVYHEFGSPTL